MMDTQRPAAIQSRIDGNFPRAWPRLPQLDGNSVALRNRAFAAPNAPLRNQRVLVWQDSGHFHAAGELLCKVGGLSFSLATDSLAALEPRLQGFESFVPSQACTTLVEHALAPVLDLIEMLTGHTVTCDEFMRIDAGGRPGTTGSEDAFVRVGFVLFGAADQAKVRGWMNAPTALWRIVDFSRTPGSVSTRHRAVPLRLSAQLGRCRLPLGELGALQPGDALRVTPKPRRDAEGLAVQLVHVSGRLGCQAHLIGDRLILQTSMDPLLDTSPSLADDSASASLAGSDFATGIECELTFELGSIRMTLGEIARLRVGQALRMGLRLQEQPVSIMTSGRQIARGELAGVGDELVVVVTQTQGLPDV